METKPPSKHLVIMRFKHLRSKHRGFIKQLRFAKTDDVKKQLIGKVLEAEKEIKSIVREYSIRVTTIS